MQVVFFHFFLVLIKYSSLFLFTATNPGQFFVTIIICLSPLFLLSSYLAYRLAKQIEREETAKHKQQTKITKIKRKRADKRD